MEGDVVTPGRRERVRRIVAEAADCDPLVREALLSDRCGGDDALRAEVLRLLRDDTVSSREDSLASRTDADIPLLDETRAGGLEAVPAAAGPLPEIPGYEIVAELGRGGMGVVYKAVQLQLNRTCALKLISAGGLAGGEAMARFLAEAKTIARLRHPNVVQVYHYGQHDGQPFLEMEFAEGGTLARRLTGTPWPAVRAAWLIDAVARAVDEAHGQRVVHRDLKPANILLTANGSPKVADFGLAKSLEAGVDLTIAGVILGTPYYMAPEQAEGASRAVGMATDVYALGAILYELLTGRPPFRGKTLLEVLERIKTARPVRPRRLAPGIPRDIEAICLKCLSKSPAQRYDSAGELAEDVRRFINGEPTMARLTDGGEWAGRRPVPPTLVGVIAVVVALAGLAFALYRRSDREAVAPVPPGVPYTVRAGDHPFAIAEKMLGDGNRWREIRKADGSALEESDARRLLPGQVLYVPPRVPR